MPSKKTSDTGIVSVYTKTHKSKTVAEKHARKVRARGGGTRIEKAKGKFKLIATYFH